jgi:hypothetical protein
VRARRQKFTLDDAIGSRTCSLEASRRVTNGIPLGCPLFLPVHTVNCVQTLKDVVLSAIGRKPVTDLLDLNIAGQLVLLTSAVSTRLEEGVRAAIAALTIATLRRNVFADVSGFHSR